MRIALRRGRLERQRVSALITSANDSLVGNLQPDYWRFEGGINVDGALRAMAGPDLVDACLALPVLDTEDRRDLVRWTRAVKVHESAVVRCPTGSAVKTTAGSLDADYIIHAVAPDVELTYGRYLSSEGPRICCARPTARRLKPRPIWSAWRARRSAPASRAGIRP